MECVLKFCVEVYNASVVSGILEQTVVQTFNRTNPHIATNGTWPDATFDFQIDTDPVLIPGPSSHSTFNISAKALLALQSRLPSLFSGNYTTGTHGLASGGVFPTDIIQRLYFTYGTNVTALTAYLAATMTASVRRNPARSLSLFFNDPDNETALATPYSAPIYPGTAYRTVPHIKVVWGWIALPAAGVLFANVFLAVTMWMTHTMRKSSGVGVWKSSQIPLLYHGLDVKSELRMETELGGDANIHEMEEVSRRLDVRLERSAGVDGEKGVLKLEM